MRANYPRNEKKSHPNIQREVTSTGLVREVFKRYLAKFACEVAANDDNPCSASSSQSCSATHLTTHFEANALCEEYCDSRDEFKNTRRSVQLNERHQYHCR